MRFIPNFFKEMPKSQKGRYRIYTAMFFLYVKNKEYSDKIYNNKLTAYLVVRLMAFKRDLAKLGSECGVVWGIEEIN